MLSVWTAFQVVRQIQWQMWGGEVTLNAAYLIFESALEEIMGYGCTVLSVSVQQRHLECGEKS